jgi:hypothetical protein
MTPACAEYFQFTNRGRKMREKKPFGILEERIKYHFIEGGEGPAVGLVQKGIQGNPV